MITLETRVDPSIMAAVARAEPKALRNFLRRATRQRAKPTLADAKAGTPVDTGKLQRSLSIQGFATQDGVIGQAILPNAGTFTFKDTTGRKRLVLAAKWKQKASDKVKVDRARAKGWDVDQNNPYYYALGIETGFKKSGRVARKAGGAKMLENATRKNAAQFMRETAADVFDYVTQKP